MSDISKLILEKQEQDRKKAQEVEVARLNEIVKDLYSWFDEKNVNVNDARRILKGVLDALESSMSVKMRPHQEEEGKKIFKEFYAELNQAQK